MSTKGTKRAGKKAGGLSDLSPKAGRAKAVKGGAVNAFITFFDKADGESIQKVQQGSGLVVTATPVTPTAVTRPPSVR